MTGDGDARHPGDDAGERTTRPCPVCDGVRARVLFRQRFAAFVDSNPKYQGKRLDGVSILSPEALKTRSEPILLSSQVFEREIERQSRENLGIGNEVILLYRDRTVT